MKIMLTKINKFKRVKIKKLLRKPPGVLHNKNKTILIRNKSPLGETKVMTLLKKSLNQVGVTRNRINKKKIKIMKNIRTIMIISKVIINNGETETIAREIKMDTSKEIITEILILIITIIIEEIINKEIIKVKMIVTAEEVISKETTKTKMVITTEGTIGIIITKETITIPMKMARCNKKVIGTKTEINPRMVKKSIIKETNGKTTETIIRIKTTMGTVKTEITIIKITITIETMTIKETITRIRIEETTAATTSRTTKDKTILDKIKAGKTIKKTTLTKMKINKNKTFSQKQTGEIRTHKIQSRISSKMLGLKKKKLDKSRISKIASHNSKIKELLGEIKTKTIIKAILTLSKTRIVRITINNKPETLGKEIKIINSNQS